MPITTQIARGGLTRYNVSVQFPVAMLSGGLVDIVMPAVTGSLQGFCSSLGTTPALYEQDYLTCVNSVAQNYTITGLASVVAQQVLNFDVWAVAPDSGTPSFSVQAYQDTSRVISLFQSTTTILSPAAISAYYPFVTLHWVHTQGPVAVTAGAVSDFSFTMTTIVTSYFQGASWVILQGSFGHNLCTTL